MCLNAFSVYSLNDVCSSVETTRADVATYIIAVVAEYATSHNIVYVDCSFSFDDELAIVDVCEIIIDSCLLLIGGSCQDKSLWIIVR